jgi:putative copper export protein
MYGLLVLLHVLGAAVWTGGHLVLAIAVLPRVLRDRDVKGLLAFEGAFERIGMPALVIQILTGLLLAHRALPDVSQWFRFQHPVSHLVAGKLLLLGLTLALAAHARLRLIPSLDEHKLKALAWHIVPVTVIAVLFVVLGVEFRTGLF